MCCYACSIKFWQWNQWGLSEACRREARRLFMQRRELHLKVLRQTRRLSPFSCLLVSTSLRSSLLKILRVVRRLNPETVLLPASYSACRCDVLKLSDPFPPSPSPSPASRKSILATPAFPPLGSSQSPSRLRIILPIFLIALEFFIRGGLFSDELPESGSLGGCFGWDVGAGGGVESSSGDSSMAKMWPSISLESKKGSLCSGPSRSSFTSQVEPSQSCPQREKSASAPKCSPESKQSILAYLKLFQSTKLADIIIDFQSRTLAPVSSEAIVVSVSPISARTSA